MTYQKILVALDNSPHREEVFTKSLEIAKQDGAALMLFHCLPVEHSITPYSNLYGEELLNLSPVLREKLEQEKHDIEQWLTQYCQIAKEQGIEAEWTWKMGEAGFLIEELATSWHADLVIMGRRGISGIKELILGSVSSYVVHHVHCSVLIVQGKDLE